MNRCQGHTTRCDGTDLIPVEFRGTARRVLVVCAGCRSTTLYQSASTVERRVQSIPVSEDRRAGWKPAWLRNLQAVDRTGEVYR